ncbi:MAG: MarR family winged helix-turn-helix transcriptional regulator [Phycisphaerales bacterium]
MRRSDGTSENGSGHAAGTGPGGGVGGGAIGGADAGRGDAKGGGGRERGRGRVLPEGDCEGVGERVERAGGERGPRNLAEEVGKSRAFSCPAQEAYLNLVRTHESFEGEFERFFKEHGLSHSQYNALRILRGHSPKAVACSVIAREMVTREPDITRLIDRLERAGLAERARCTQDRRVVRVRITAKALSLLERLDEPVMRMHRTQLAHLSHEELRVLSDLLFRARHPGAAAADGGGGVGD